MKRLRFINLVILFLVSIWAPLLSSSPVSAAPSQPQPTDTTFQWASKTNDPFVGLNNNTSTSYDGRYVAFTSKASDLVGGDTNNAYDIFVYDSLMDTTERVSVTDDENEFTEYSAEPIISSNGRFVLFVNHPPGSTSGVEQVYLRDRLNLTTTVVSTNSNGELADFGASPLGISDDGTKILMGRRSSTNLNPPGYPYNHSVLIKDLTDGSMHNVPAPDPTGQGATLTVVSGTISVDGNIVLLNATASSFQGVYKVVAIDLLTNTSQIVSDPIVGSANDHASVVSISRNERYVVFQSFATNLASTAANQLNYPKIFWKDLLTGELKHIDQKYSGNNIYGTVSSGGRGNVSISDDGRFVGFSTNNPSLDPSFTPTPVSPIRVSAYVRDTVNNTTHMVVNQIITGDSIYAPGSGRFVFVTTDIIDQNDSSTARSIYIARDGLFDTTAPVLGTPVWVANPVVTGNNTSFSVTVTDNDSGVADGEYFIETDPGVGNATALSWDGTNLNSSAFGSNLSAGTYNIGIRAKDNVGNWSNVTTVQLVVQDPSAPSIAYSIADPNGENGWYTSPETLSWTVEDPESTINSQTGCDTFVLDTDTAGVTKTCEATSAGGTTTESVTLKYDATAPVVDTPAWDENPQAIGSDSTVIVAVTDATSGVTAGEYFMGADPGVGNGTAMTLSTGTLSATVGASLPIGDHVVNIRARDEAGNWSSVTTTTLTVIDASPPEITYTLNPGLPINGWYLVAPTLTWDVSDPETAITAQTGCETVTVDSDTAGSDFTCSATSAGGTSTQTVNVKLDATMPVLGTPIWTANPVILGNGTSFSIPVTDATSGISGGEYFIGTDPGAGNATALTWDGTNLNSASFGANLTAGVYNIGIRAKDVAGNWTSTLTTYLVVFDPAGPGYIVGQQNVKPGTGDTLPWISTNPADFATFGFNVEFTSTGMVDSSSEFNFSYVEKGSCNNPNATTPCHSFVLTATNFSWFAVGGTNNSEGTFQGTGTLNIDSVNSTVLFRVESVDGNQLTPTQADSFVLKIYAEGSNPQTDAPLHQVSADFTPGSGNANGGVQVKN